MGKFKISLKWIMGVVATCIITELLIKPLIGIIGNLSDGIFNSFVNHYYFSCSTAKIEVLIISVITVFLFWFYLRQMKESIQLIRDLKRQHKEFQALEDRINNICVPEKIEQVTEKSISEEKATVISDIKKGKKTTKLFSYICNICIVILLLCFLSLLFFNIAPCIHKVAFDQAIVKITPYIEKNEVDMLKSDWTRMKTKADYKEIDNFIDSIIEKNNLN
ncbi:MAG: hypothetical protein II996_03970 [Oscillospiraceae bacterium]|nr:hypothetical protein [Oscillospiraceae bacterium]